MRLRTAAHQTTTVGRVGLCKVNGCDWMNPCRAERFGTDYVKPEKRSDLRQQFRRERLKKDGFKTGLDLFDEVQLSSNHFLLLLHQFPCSSPSVIKGHTC